MAPTATNAALSSASPTSRRPGVTRRIVVEAATDCADLLPEAPLARARGVRSAGDASVGRMNVLWTDATIERCTLRCRGYIGFSVEGFWDEAIVERAELSTTHPAIQRARDAIGRRHRSKVPTSGSPARNDGVSSCLTITLIDGCEIVVVAARFES